MLGWVPKIMKKIPYFFNMLWEGGGGGFQLSLHAG